MKRPTRLPSLETRLQRAAQAAWDFIQVPMLFALCVFIGWLAAQGF